MVGNIYICKARQVMKNEELIRLLQLVRQEIEDYIKTGKLPREYESDRGNFYICSHSLAVDDCCWEVVKELKEYGEERLGGFDGYIAFSYTQSGRRIHGIEYNKAKIAHIDSFISYLKWKWFWQIITKLRKIMCYPLYLIWNFFSRKLLGYS